MIVYKIRKNHFGFTFHSANNFFYLGITLFRIIFSTNMNVMLKKILGIYIFTKNNINQTIYCLFIQKDDIRYSFLRNLVLFGNNIFPRQLFNVIFLPYP